MKKLLLPALLILLLAAGIGIWKSFQSFDSLVATDDHVAAMDKKEDISAPAIQPQGNEEAIIPEHLEHDTLEKPEPFIPPGYTYTKSPLPGQSHYQSDPEPTVEEALNAMTEENRTALLQLREGYINLQNLRKEYQTLAQQRGLTAESSPELAAINRQLQIEQMRLKQERHRVTGALPGQIPDAFWATF